MRLWRSPLSRLLPTSETLRRPSEELQLGARSSSVPHPAAAGVLGSALAKHRGTDSFPSAESGPSRLPV